MTSKAKKVQRKEKKTEESQEESKEHHEPTKEAEDTGEKELFQEEKKNPSLYDLLQIEKTATIAEIKKAYKVLALKLHPDKNKDDPETTKSFQTLNEAYQILSDPEKRKLYDETGYTGADDSAGFAEAYNFYRAMFRKIEKKDIEDFEKKYKYSKEEEEDVLKYYVDNKGDITYILESVILSTNEDLPRFIKMIEDKIASKEVRKFKAFDTTKKKVKMLDDEEEEFKAEQEKSFKELTNAIMLRTKERSSQFGNFMELLEQKYINGNKKKGKQKSEYDIDDETFEKIQAERFGQKSKKVKK